jgi:hypothetical protein
LVIMQGRTAHGSPQRLRQRSSGPLRRLAGRLGGAALTTLALSAGAPPSLCAQDTLPPHLGGSIASLGLPPARQPYALIALSLDRGLRDQMGAQLHVGVADPIGSPVLQLLTLAGEAYGGVRDGKVTAGGRAVALSPAFGVGLGADLDAGSARLDPFLLATAHVRRGGLIGRGTHLRFEWYPTRSGSASVALAVPLQAGHLGRTRPMRDHVQLRAAPARHIDYDPPDELIRSLSRAEESAYWINRFSIVPLGAPARDVRASVARAVEPLKGRLAQRTAAEEIAAYHAELDRAFAIAVSGRDAAHDPTRLGETVAQQAREVLLETVLLPYNRMLGQHKREDTTTGFAVHARGSFARWLVHHSQVAPDRFDGALFVFQRMLDIAELTRAHNLRDRGASRLVWLPLQLALRPEQYTTKESLDSLISDAVGRRVVHGNRMWYVYNSRFHQQLVRSIGEAEEYHVLWVHDFRGLGEHGRPDTLSLLLVTRAYFAALTQRVAAYDETGHLPVFMLFLDQLYFEMNGSRELLQMLQDPMHHRLRLPSLSPELAEVIAQWQAGLRDAVDASRLLSAERQEYGEPWLRRLVKVHVSVTHPADPSFRSRNVVPHFNMPDDLMRDHRKAVVYDVSEEDPFRGMAIYAGMGVGEQYATPAWDDRALMLQGPAALALRDAARRLLEAHGLHEGQIPHVLRPRARPEDYDARVRAEIETMDDRGEVAVRAVELHNSTGFGPKEIAVAQATLFNLTSPGAVFKIPDSLWLNELFASLLAGAALRGTRVLPVAPSGSSAPASAWGGVAVHDVFSRLIALSSVLRPEIDRAGGLLRPGIYHSVIGVDDVNARVAQLAHSLARYPFLRSLYPTLPAFLEQAAGDIVATEDGAVPLPEPLAPSMAPSKLHLKGFLYVSGPAWSHLIEGPPVTDAMRVYLEERRKLSLGQADEVAMGATLRRVGAEIINPIIDALPEGERSSWAFFLQVGSPNLDYRSMMLDGEVAALITDWTSLYGFFDFMLLMGLVEWPDDQDGLDALLPQPNWLKRRLARWLRFTF